MSIPFYGQRALRRQFCSRLVNIACCDHVRDDRFPEKMQSPKKTRCTSKPSCEYTLHFMYIKYYLKRLSLKVRPPPHCTQLLSIAYDENIQHNPRLCFLDGGFFTKGTTYHENKIQLQNATDWMRTPMATTTTSSFFPRVFEIIQKGKFINKQKGRISIKYPLV